MAACSTGVYVSGCCWLRGLLMTMGMLVYEGFYGISESSGSGVEGIGCGFYEGALGWGEGEVVREERGEFFGNVGHV